MSCVLRNQRLRMYPLPFSVPPLPPHGGCSSFPLFTSGKSYLLSSYLSLILIFYYLLYLFLYIPLVTHSLSLYLTLPTYYTDYRLIVSCCVTHCSIYILGVLPVFYQLYLRVLIWPLLLVLPTGLRCSLRGCCSPGLWIIWIVYLTFIFSIN
jgi:hypothetical protein